MLSSDRYAGRDVTIGTAVVRFGRDGVAIGIVQRGNDVLPAPEPIDDAVRTQAGIFNGCFDEPRFIIGGAVPVPEPGPEAEPENEPESEGDGDTRPLDIYVDDLSGANKRELYAAAMAAGLSVTTRMPVGDIRAAIEAARGG